MSIATALDGRRPLAVSRDALTERAAAGPFLPPDGDALRFASRPAGEAGISACPVVSIILATRNRRDELLHTLGKLHSPRPCHAACEIIVVDNASSDGTAAIVADRYPGLRLIRSANNRGACAKNLGLAEARGQFVLLLDDDSYPEPGAIDAMLGHFAAEPRLAAISFAVRLPSGAGECSAYPSVFIGCGVGLRKSALDEIGHLPDDFFMQAEEYDVSLRLLAAGWRVRRCPDLLVHHRKSPAARISDRTMRLDVRNNLLLIARYFPSRWTVRFARDWMLRYAAIAASTGHRCAFWRGLGEGLLRAAVQPRSPLPRRAFEEFAKVEEIANRLDHLRRHEGIRRVMLIDLGKNIFPFLRGARRAGIQVLAIADNRLAGPRRRFRGIPILTDRSAWKLDYDAAIIANFSLIHAEQRREYWRSRQSRPVVDVLESLATPGRTGMAA